MINAEESQRVTTTTLFVENMVSRGEVQLPLGKFRERLPFEWSYHGSTWHREVLTIRVPTAEPLSATAMPCPLQWFTMS